MKPTPSFAAQLLALIVVLSFTACSARPKYKTGDYLMPSGSSDPAKIVKVVAVSDSNYKVFTHFLSDGRLIQAQDYQNLSRSDVDTGYSAVEPPHTDGTFSPDRYISKHADDAAKPK
jgi:hypothetical protein